MAKPNMSLTRNEMPTQDALVRARNFDEVALGYSETPLREKKRKEKGRLEMEKLLKDKECLHCEKFFDCKVSLKLWVKVKEDWRNRPNLLIDYGYDKRNFD